MIGRQQNNQEGKTPSLFIPQGGPNQASLSFCAKLSHLQNFFSCYASILIFL